jgi:uncharacterized protein
MNSKILGYLVGVNVRMTDFLGKHPLLVEKVLRRIANLPLSRKYLKVIVRAFMGATAFDCHLVDVEKGRVNFSGVEEIIMPAVMVKIQRQVLAEILGEEEAEKAFYEMGYEGMYREMSYGIGEGRWIPGFSASLINETGSADKFRSDPSLGRMIEESTALMLRLIAMEGGWGNVASNILEEPIKVTVKNSPEARWLGPSDKPVCHMFAGVSAGNTSFINGVKYRARETSCMAMGAPCCVFELEKESA